MSVYPMDSLIGMVRDEGKAHWVVFDALLALLLRALVAAFFAAFRRSFSILEFDSRNERE